MLKRSRNNFIAIWQNDERPVLCRSFSHPKTKIFDLETESYPGEHPVNSASSTESNIQGKSVTKEAQIMSEIKLFENPEFGQVRTMVIDGEPWFVGKDIATILGYTNPLKAIRVHVDEEDKGVNEMDTPGGVQKIGIINESGLYSMILGSKLPKAKGFKRWVTSEVLPSIRKTGMYQVPQTKEELYRTAFLSAMEDMKALEAQVEEMEPKVTYHDLVLQTPDLVTTTVVAKDFGLTAAGLNKILHEEGVQYKQGRTWVPYKEYAEKGYMRSSTSLYTDGEGEQHSSVLYKWTQKGRLFVYNLLAEKDIHPVIEMGNGENQKVVNLFE